MEAALPWLFGSVHSRVPDGRTSSFTQPLFPPSLTRQSHATKSPPKGTLTCPLPTPRAFGRPRSATVGWQVHDWAHHTAFYTLNSRGQRIFVQQWRPLPTQPQRNRLFRILTAPFRRHPMTEKAVIHIIHGLNDHSNKYVRVARAWVNAGFVVVAHDFHGHGRSDGMRAYTSSMQHYVQDARDAIAASDERMPSRLATLPKFLLAHSMGGAVAIHLARDAKANAFQGVMLTAPAVRVFPKPLLKLFAPALATLAPLLPVQRLKFDRWKRRRSQGKVVATATATAAADSRRKTNGHDSGDDDDYCPHEDPLVIRSPVRARVGYEVLKSCEKIMSEAERFRLPVFVAHSAQDRVTNVKGTIEFHGRIGSHDKTVQLYDGSVHDLLAKKRELVMADMVEWASKRLR